MPSEVSEKWTTGPAKQKFPPHLLQEMRSPVSSTFEREEAALPGSAELEAEEAKRVRIHARCIVRGAMLLAAVLWLLVSAATILEQNPQLAWRVFRKQLPRTLSIVEELEISWPGVSVYPHALACGAEGHIFVASDFQVFRLLPGSSGKVSAVPEPCNASGLISDVVSTCAGGLKGGSALLHFCVSASLRLSGSAFAFRRASSLPDLGASSFPLFTSVPRLYVRSTVLHRSATFKCVCTFGRSVMAVPAS